MKLLITGKIKSGKSTLVGGISEIIQIQKVGFKTYFDNQRQMLFLEILNGEKFLIAKREEKMVGIKEELDRISKKLDEIPVDNKILFIDEIGYVESVSDKFINSLVDLIERSEEMIAVIRIDSPLRSRVSSIKGIKVFEICKVE